MRSALSQLLALGPELAIYLLTAPLYAGRAHAANAQSASPVTNLDLSQLGRVAVGGDFDSISLYAYEGQNENTSTNGSEALLTRYPDGAFQSLALADADASIATMCAYTKDGDLKGVIVGGNFTSLGGVAAASVALWNPTSDKVTALPGLSGPVSALYCDDATGTVYVGGNFIASSSTNAMAWAEDWINLPFAGFNGPVASIAKNTAGNIVFGGQFDGLGNATSPEVADQQVINLGGGNVTAMGSTTTAGYSDPSNIVCSTGEDSSGNTWLLEDGKEGYWDGTYGYGFIPTKMRLYNTAQDGRGTKTFYFEEMNSGGILNLTYVDPTTGQNASCIQECPLPENNTTAQDFRFVSPVGMSHFRIFITDYYGAGAGLSGIEMFEDEIFSYAVNAFNEPKCDGVTNGSSSTATPASLWTEVANDGQTSANFLSASLTETLQVTSDTNVVFKPSIKQSGNYSVMVYTPGCILDNSCATRGQVNMTATTSSDAAPVSTTLFQTNNYDKFDQIYYGYIDADDSSFSPSVTLAPVSGQSVPLTVVASRVRFELVTTTGGLNGLYEYNPNEATTNTDFSTSTINAAGSSLESDAQVNSVIQGDSALYVGGDFSGSGIANILAVSTNGTSLPSSGGLDGPVLDMHLNGTKLYIGGSFNDTSESSTTGLNNIALYSTADDKWSALGAGVNGAVFSLVPLQLNISSGDLKEVLTVTGNFTSVNAYSGNAAYDADGFAVWVPSETTWLNNIASANVALGGQLTSYTEVPDNEPLYGGSITSQGLDYSSAVELVGSGDGVPSLQSIGVQLEQSSHAADTSSSTMRKRGLVGETSGQNYTGVYDGLFYGANNLNITVLGGSFSATATNGSALENLVFVNYTNTDPTVSGVSGLDSDSIFVAMDTYGTQLWAGGAVNGTVNGNEATGLIVYDMAINDFVSPHPPALAGNSVTVNAIAAQPSSTSVYVGGDFDTAGSLPCNALCNYDSDLQAWQTTGTGLRGTINALLWASNTKLMLAGNFTIDGNKTTLATYDTKKQTYEAYTGADTLPGPIIAITAVNSQYTEFWVGGVSTSDNSAFLSRYSNGNWASASGLGSATTIRKLQIMPLSSNHADSDLMADDQVLMILGNVNIPDVGNASAVLYNGTSYEPFILTSMDDGSQGSLSAVFVSNPQNFITSSSHHLALGLVVVIGLAIALGIIFLLVCAGILLERRRRRLEGYVPMTADKSSNIARLPPEALFQNIDNKGSTPKL